ncbi:MAG: nucleotidyltransferase [Ekhidna sp.]|uniref:nucleotidyltransferase n=1 Tax=Ekhidna sp. TaxID=2608089 RepID=UPI0032968996
MMLTPEQKKQFSDILEELGRTLDITEEQHKAAVTSYEFVGEWLSKDDSPLAPYQPEILPQGSFMLGTMIRPTNEDDDLDIDLVCRLEGKQFSWTQVDVKAIIGDRLADHGMLKKLLELPDGRRCWTLQYSDSANFHMDVLPAVTSSGYRILMERTFSETDASADTLAIRITDKYEENYRTDPIPENWPKSNPFGYGKWFESRARISGREIKMMSEAVQPVPRYQKNKLPLQRVVQILKRHRDIMFNGDEDKPISIIITTLTARAYQQETDIYQALQNALDRIPAFIEERWSDKYQRNIKWISNPVNPEENFADKWPEKPQKEANFYDWLTHVKKDISEALGQSSMTAVMESLKQPFGDKVINEALGGYGKSLLHQRESGAMKMAAGTGVVGEVGRTTVTQHNPYGKNK